MISLKSSRNYIIVKNEKELELAKTCDVCGYIIWEKNNVIYIWERLFGKWVKNKYVIFGNSKDRDEETTGLRAYQSFYAYCGKEEVERMKHIFTPIPMWESYEQMHYANIEFIGQKIYQPIYEFDANSAFSYGTLGLPVGFEVLQEYMKELFIAKKNSTNTITQTKYKNLQNFLIGYFARINEFIRVRSEIIHNSNLHIQKNMTNITKNGGICFLSNTDSIITDTKGSEVMFPVVGTELGEFKLSTKTDKLFYKSPNAYQLGEKIVYSGVKYFARQHTDFFKEQYAEQSGSLIKGFNFTINLEDDTYNKLCKVKYGEIEVIVLNKIGEVLDIINYRIGE